MLYYYLMSRVDFDAWSSPLKDRFPSPACANDDSEYILTKYQGPIALTDDEVQEIEDAGGIEMDRDTAKAYKEDNPAKWDIPV